MRPVGGGKRLFGSRGPALRPTRRRPSTDRPAVLACGGEPARHEHREIHSLHTLGPEGTNCELAAHRWFERVGRRGHVVLHPTLEKAADAVLVIPGAGLIACAAYPDLHTLIYTRLGTLVMVDCILVNTHNMVLARRRDAPALGTLALHPALSALLPGALAAHVEVTSNSEAARCCAAAITDACLTTLPAARARGLVVEHDFGPVPLSFSVHKAIGGRREIARRLHPSYVAQ